ncbi:DUF77-domain-containing protein [Mycena indigotica]|uniref:DUF77-domain-containing protein n=1 Tax=Mycena indigotica TaxID=2126181 RepID=A0A8H6VVH6_9AGAR|nr:DUF77-domain-containing protein [Mycena indigotica]KAF7295484.1 DUF77-domain-containing protein [Mycena indigotica]
MTELYATADFCLIPMGTGETSVAEYIAECQRILEKSGLVYKMQYMSSSNGGYGTNLEGPWGAVSQAIHDCHAAVHEKGALRIATDIRIGTRTDREVASVPGGLNEAKVKRVEEILAKDGSKD